jgi:poly-gamma-glutamate capsule biosynthesis protein CapA/YwtB (metallophosphatase superfamily)
MMSVNFDPPTVESTITQTPFIPEPVNPLPDTATPSPSPTETATVTSTPTETSTSTPTSTAAPSRTVNLEAVGDIMLARTIAQQIASHGPQVVFAGVQTELNNADILVGNLECTITSSVNHQAKSYTFAAPPETAQSLALAGFDVMSLANNHAMDFGSSGLLDTRAILKQYGIESVGGGLNSAEAHNPVILVRNGLRMAFLAYLDVPRENGGFDAHAWIAGIYTPGIAWADPKQIATDVTAAKKEADVVIVLLHSGYEITTIIPNISINQREEAHAAIDAGASLVLGSHPHFLQPIELYHGGLIAYSLGNFVFDDYLGIANETVILRVVLTSAGIQSYEWVPVWIENGLPKLTDIKNVPAIGTLVAPITP